MSDNCVECGVNPREDTDILCTECLSIAILSCDDVFDAMERHGGGFVKHLGAAWRRADASNQLKLGSAFSDVYDTYAKIVLRAPKESSDETITISRQRLNNLRNEINCRIEHGAEGAAHLQYIEDQIKDMLNDEGGGDG